MAIEVPIIPVAQEVVCIVDVPYNFTDENGKKRSGITRKCVFLDYDTETDTVRGVGVSKCVPEFRCDLKRRGTLNYDRNGRVQTFTPLSGDD